jgi:hypothetical protein
MQTIQGFRGKSMRVIFAALLVMVFSQAVISEEVNDATERSAVVEGGRPLLWKSGVENGERGYLTDKLIDFSSSRPPANIQQTSPVNESSEASSVPSAEFWQGLAKVLNAISAALDENRIQRLESRPVPRGW